MTARTSVRIWIGFIGLTAALILLFTANLNLGSVQLTPAEIWRILIERSGERAAIILNIRLPRILAVILLGGALSVSGFLLQTFFANPIAGPFILGISSGAKLAVALALIGFLGRGIQVGSVTLITAAFLGSTLSMGFVLSISSRVKRMSMLIVSGVMLGYIFSAITDFVVTFADDSNIVNLHNWSQGSFSGMSWEHVRVMAVFVSLAVLAAFLLSKPISAYQLGEIYAQNLGVNLRRFRFALIFLSSVLSASVTAFAGPISFVGVAVPHLVRRIYKTEKPLIVIPACFIGGAVFCLFSDLIARTVFSPTELNISSVTALFGAPIVIFIMIQRKNQG